MQPKLARGTRDNLTTSTSTATLEPAMGETWFYSLCLEYLGRNLATAGMMEYFYRLGKAQADIEAHRYRVEAKRLQWQERW